MIPKDAMLGMVVPSDAQQAKKKEIASRVMEMVQNASEYSDVVGVELGGSFAKGTWLADADIDVFVKFHESVPADIFEDLALKIGHRSLEEYNPYIRYSEHPYTEADIDGTKINVVPFYDTKLGCWKSSADRSPYHTTFMKKNLSSQAKDEVRLLKKFLDMWNIYGANTERQGFSGYAAETLIYKYGSFEDVVGAMSNIKSGAIIGSHAKKFDTAITITDPIDDNRNLAAAVSSRNIGIFILACRRFAREPSIETFKSNITIKSHFWDNVISVSFRHSKKTPETIWGQAKGAAAAVARRLGREGFSVIRYTTSINNSRIQISFLLELLCLPRVHVRSGPDVFRRAASGRFIKKNDDAMVWVGEDLRLYCMIQRAENRADAFLDYIFKNPKFAGIPPGLHKDIQDGYTILSGPEMKEAQREQAKALMDSW